MNYGIKDAVDAKTGVSTGDRVVSINEDESYGFMEPTVANAALLQLLRERELDEPLPISVERDGEIMVFEFDELPLGLMLRSEDNLLLIDQAPEGQPASTAGLTEGDRIVSVEGNDAFAVLSVTEAMHTLSSFLLPPPHSVTIKVLRSSLAEDSSGGGGGDDLRAVCASGVARFLLNGKVLGKSQGIFSRSEADKGFVEGNIRAMTDGKSFGV